MSRHIKEALCAVIIVVFCIASIAGGLPIVRSGTQKLDYVELVSQINAKKSQLQAVLGKRPAPQAAIYLAFLRQVVQVWRAFYAELMRALSYVEQDSKPGLATSYKQIFFRLTDIEFERLKTRIAKAHEGLAKAQAELRAELEKRGQNNDQEAQEELRRLDEEERQAREAEADKERTAREHAKRVALAPEVQADIRRAEEGAVAAAQLRRGFFVGLHTPEGITERKKKLAMLLHPDKGGSTEAFKAMMAEYEEQQEVSHLIDLYWWVAGKNALSPLFWQDTREYFNRGRSDKDKLPPVKGSQILAVTQGLVAKGADINAIDDGQPIILYLVILAEIQEDEDFYLRTIEYLVSQRGFSQSKALIGALAGISMRPDGSFPRVTHVLELVLRNSPKLKDDPEDLFNRTSDLWLAMKKGNVAAFKLLADNAGIALMRKIMASDWLMREAIGLLADPAASAILKERRGLILALLRTYT